MRDVVGALEARVRTNGAAPLLTWYDLGTGERTELSGRTFANWVDKATHLLGEVGIEAGDALAVPLLRSHPGHWMTAVVAMACWQSGALLTSRPAADTAVVVVGPEDPHPSARATVLACSLHPLGLGFASLPAGVIDVAAEVRAQPDVHVVAPLAPQTPAWRVDAHVLTHGDLAAEAGTAQRVLVRPSDEVTTLTHGLLAPLLGGGSVVVVRGEADPERLAELATRERALLSP